MKSNFETNTIFQKTICPSDEKLMAYIENTLPLQEKRMIELHLVDCEMCNDTVEGLQKIDSRRITGIVSELNNKIDRANFEKNKKKLGNITWYYSVAAIFVVVLSGFLYRYYFQNSETQNLAELKPIPEKESIKPEIQSEKNEVKKIKEAEKETITIDQNKIESVAKYKTFKDGTKQGAISDDSESLAEAVNEKNREPVTGNVEENSKKIIVTANEKSGYSSDSDLARKEEVTAPQLDEGVDATIQSNTNSSPSIQAMPESREYDKSKALSEVEVKGSRSNKILEKSEDLNSNSRLTEIEKQFKNKNYKKVITISDEVLLTDPNQCQSLYYRGCSNSALEKLNLAELDFEKLLQLNCGEWTESTKIDLALLYKKTDRKEAGKSLLEQAAISHYSDISIRAKKEIEGY